VRWWQREPPFARLIKRAPAVCTRVLRKNPIRARNDRVSVRRLQDVQGLHPGFPTSFGTCARLSVAVSVSSPVSGGAARLWQLRICSCANNWLYSGSGRRKRCPRLLPTGLYSPNWFVVSIGVARIDDRQTGHFDRLASQRIPAVLALEIETGREAPSDGRSQGLDSAFSG